MTFSTPHNQRQANPFPNEISSNKEDIQLIWLDEKMDQSTDCLLTQSMLLELNPAVQFYSDLDRCISLIKSIRQEQTFLIVSGALVRLVLEQIHHHRTLVAIFIYCSNPCHHLPLSTQYNKIIGAYRDQDTLVKSIRDKMIFIGKQSLAFSLFDQKQKSVKDLSKESAAFLWHQMLIFVLRQMPQDEQSKREMLQTCRDYYQNSRFEMRKILEFQRKYTRAKAIEWYTDECFLYRLLNKALRTENIDLLYQFRFFIIDLCATIEEDRYRLKNKKTLILYRGTQIPDEELQKLKENVGKIIATNGFLSTTRDVRISLAFACPSSTFGDFQAVLFEIHIDPSIKTVVFADIEGKTRMKGESEMLFTLNSRFKIHAVNFDSGLNLWKVQLHATDEGAQLVDEYLQLSKRQLEEYPPIIYFGRLLMNELDRMDEAERYFKRLLRLLPCDHCDIASVYNSIGTIHDERNALNSALEHYEKAYEIRRERLPATHPHIAASLNNLGGIHRKKGNYDLALERYRQCFDIDKINHSGDHLSKAISLENIGLVYADQEDLNKSLDHLFAALEIYQRILPEDHVHIATCLGFIGSVYEQKGKLDVALDFYYRQLTIKENCLPGDHRYLSIDLASIVNIYIKTDKIEEGTALCEKKLAGQKNELGDHHPAVARTLMIMGDIYKNHHLNQALDYYKQALSIFETSIPIDHQAVADCQTHLACLYRSYGLYTEALKWEAQALDRRRQVFPADHIDIGNSLRIIAFFYQKMNDHFKALDYFDQCLTIFRANYGSGHERVKQLERDTDELKMKKSPTSNTTVEIEMETTETHSALRDEGLSIVSTTNAASQRENSPQKPPMKKTGKRYVIQSILVE